MSNLCSKLGHTVYPINILSIIGNIFVGNIADLLCAIHLKLSVEETYYSMHTLRVKVNDQTMEFSMASTLLPSKLLPVVALFNILCLTLSP